MRDPLVGARCPPGRPLRRLRHDRRGPGRPGALGQPDVWLAELVMLSCRVEGRGIAALLRWIMDEAHTAGKRALRAVYRINERNLPMRLLFRQMGFAAVGKVEAGDLVVVERDMSQPLPPYRVAPGQCSGQGDSPWPLITGVRVRALLARVLERDPAALAGLPEDTPLRLGVVARLPYRPGTAHRRPRGIRGGHRLRRPQPGQPGDDRHLVAYLANSPSPERENRRELMWLPLDTYAELRGNHTVALRLSRKRYGRAHGDSSQTSL